jgi:putative heme-binding domain-containing protein
MDGDTFEIFIQTIKEQMRYDRTEFSVAPKMKVRLHFNNPDAMDHNMLMVDPGAAPRVAILAAKLESTGEGTERQWRPDSDEILFATNLLAHDEKQTIEFNAPAAPGSYEYICTFPGHWQLMRGTMIVSETITPENILSRQITIGDPSDMPTRKVVDYWELDMLASEIDQVETNRSYVSGKAMFAVASCIKCHKVAGNGGAIGPDLTDIRSKYKPDEILAHILDPALAIEEDYKTYIVETNDKKEYVGQIITQDDQTMTILDNPLTPETAVTIKKSNVKTTDLIDISPMPTDLLITLNKNEIWDLIAYLISGGNAQDSAFK